jgi:RNA recognition motif-containing protein
MSVVRVSSVSPAVSVGHLRDLFSDCGRILSLIPEPAVADSYLVTFSSDAESSVAVLLSGVPLGGRDLSVVRLTTTPASASASGDKSPNQLSPNVSSVGSGATVSAIAAPNHAEELARTLYIGNLYPGVTADDITNFFAPHAKVTCIKLTGPASQGNTFAFVEFATLADAQKVKQMNGVNFNGFNIKVGQAQNPIVKSSSVSVSQTANRSDDSKVDPKKKLEELKRRLAKKYNAESDSVETDVAKTASDSKSRSRSRSPYDRDSKHRSSRRHRSRSRDRRSRSGERRRHRDHRDRDSRYSRDGDRDRYYRKRSPARDQQRRNDRPPRKQREDPHEGMFWDGFQWIPAAAVNSLAVNLPGVGFGLGRNNQLFK